MLRNFQNIIIGILTAILITACHDIDENENDLYGNFDALWTAIDEHYCFFKYKDVDWNEVGARYRAQIDPEWDAKQLFDHCAAMLAELKDGHTNLIAWFNVSYYRQWWSDYPQNFDLRIIQENYLKFDYASGSGFIYKLLQDRNVGYCRYASFSSTVSHSFIDNMLLEMKEADGIIIDVRDNGGGDITNVENIASHFINERTKAGSIQHKTGPGHNDFSEPYEYFFDPIEHHVRWLKPVVVLTNRSTFSAANNFVAFMKHLPHVVVIGATTGGGSGMPFSSELPGGWGVRFSASPVYDCQGVLTEYGVAPTPGGEIDLDPQDALNGIDTMLELAIRHLNNVAAQNNSASDN